MTTGSGYGAGSWGGVPWGGAEQFLEETECDLFLFETCDSMPSILTTIYVEATAADVSAQFVLIPTPVCDLEILSGDSVDLTFPITAAYITVFPPAGIDSQYTLELTITLEDLPNDFTDIVNRHVVFGVTDSAGPCAAFFLSKKGVAYAGAIHHVPPSPAVGALVLDSTFQEIPATSNLTTLGETMTFRVAVSDVVGAVYFFATKTVDLPFIGHQLIAVLPIIDAADLSTIPADDRAYISACGNSAQPSAISLDRWCLSSAFSVPNIAPIANAGVDQAIRACSIVLLDGSASFDPEGAPLLYSWRLIDGPPDSSFLFLGNDGISYLDAPFDGFTQKFYSQQLADLALVDPIQPGDVLVVAGLPHSIAFTSVDGNGYYASLTIRDLVSGLGAAPFRVVRQRGLTGADTVKPTFYADVAGYYKFDLVVFDGSLFSAPSITVVNVLESVLPRNCTPSGAFMFNYLSDFWNLLEDSNKFEEVWGAISQVVSTELYTLWQHEYSKSLRDIQRTMTRRWLHYDLLLAEPLPELTSVRALWSGIESIDIPLVGNPGIPGTSLVLNTTISSQIVIDIGFAQTAEQLQLELTNRFQEIDSRFTVTILANKPGTAKRVRIDTSIPCTVDDSSTIPVFTLGEKNTQISGVAGAANGTSAYVTQKSLSGLGIKEDDLLVLDGVGYRIVRVVDGGPLDPDQYPFQRVTLKDPLPVPASTSWKITSTVKSELLNFYGGLVSDQDDVFFEVEGETGIELVQVKAFGAIQALPGVLAIDADFLGAALVLGQPVRLAKVIRRTYFPVSPLITDIPTLTEMIVSVDDTAVIRRNVDYFLETYRNTPCLRFVSGIGGGPDIWEQQVPPSRLWAEYTYVDNRPTIEANFGLAAGLTLDQFESLPETVDYLSAVQGLWYAYFNGPKPDKIRIGAQIFLGLPFSEVAGTIIELRQNFSPTRGRILIQDAVTTEIIRAYTYPGSLGLEINPTTGIQYAAGDTVAAFAPLVSGVEVVDFITDPRWFQGLVAQGVFTEVQKYHTYLVRVDSAAFTLEALSLVRDFTLTIKPTYTYPIFVVSLTPERLDVGVEDTITYSGTLILNDGVCGLHGAPMFDDARSGGTDSWWNHFDTDDDDLTPPPTFPTPDASIVWGYDTDLLCPEDTLSAIISFVLAVPTVVTFDTFLLFDEDVTEAATFADSGPITIPAYPAVYLIPPSGTPTVASNGTVTSVRLIVTGGGPNGFDTDFELIVRVNGSDAAVVPFDATPHAFVITDSLSIPVLSGDTLALAIRIPALSPSPGARSPLWSLVSGQAVTDVGPWDFDDTLPAGTYIVQVSL